MVSAGLLYSTVSGLVRSFIQRARVRPKEFAAAPASLSNTCTAAARWTKLMASRKGRQDFVLFFAKCTTNPHIFFTAAKFRFALILSRLFFFEPGVFSIRK